MRRLSVVLALILGATSLFAQAPAYPSKINIFVPRQQFERPLDLKCIALSGEPLSVAGRAKIGCDSASNTIKASVNGGAFAALGGGGGGTWGSITGTLSSQTDLQSALNLKAPLSSPSFTTPTLGVASATTINKVTITTPASNATLTIANGATLSAPSSATVSGTNTGDQTTVSGNAGSATVLATPRAINGVNFDGSAAITVTAAAGTLSGSTLASGVTASSLTSFGNSPSFVTPALGTPVSGIATNLTGTAAGLTTGSVTTNANLTGPITSTGNATAIASQTGTGTKFVMDNGPALIAPLLGTPASGVMTNVTGTAAGLTAGAATALATARTINGDSFDGTGNIQNTLASSDFANQGTTTTLLHGAAAGNPSWAAVVSADLNITATTCTNQFVSAISSAAAGTCTGLTLAGAQFANQGTTTTVLHGNGSGNPSFGSVVNADIASATIDLTAKVTGTLPVANGGTGAATLTANNVILGNGTSAVAFVAPSTSGNVLTSNGTTWTSATPSGGSPPFTDDATQALVKGTADATKLFGINVAGITTANHPVLTIGGTTAAPTMSWAGTISSSQSNGAERFGASSNTTNNNDTAIGGSASCTGSDAVAVGHASSANQFSTAVGANAAAGGGLGTAVGYNTSAPGAGSLAIGCNALAEAAHLGSIGGHASDNCNLTDLWFGGGLEGNATPMITLHSTYGNGTNSAGSDMAISPGLGSGNANGGNLRIQTGPPGSSGSGYGTYVDRLVVKAAPVSLTSGSAAVVDDIQLPTLGMTGGKIVWTIICTDGTNMQSVSGEIVFSAVNKGGVYTTDIETVSSATPSDAITPVIGWAKALSAGTLTTAWTIVSGTNKVQVKVTATTSLTATSFKLYATIINNSEQALN